MSHKHNYHTGWFNSEHGRRVSETQFCDCGARQDVPYIKPEDPKSPTIIMGNGFGKGLSR
jgi:hypothetical protein